MRPPLLTLLLLVAPLSAQPPRPSVADLEVNDRLTDDFYGALSAGPKVKVAWGVTPATVELGGDMTLTLTVSNAANPHELTRPPLADRDEFRQLFSVIDDVTGPPPDSTAPKVEFRYRVRPRVEGKFQVPELKYVFFRRANGVTQLNTVRAEAIPFTVTKPVVRASAAVPVDGPPRFFELRTNGPFARSGGPGAGWWAGLFGGAAVVGLGWVVGWRVLFPDAARLAKVRRNRAVRVALDRLRKAATPPDPAASAAVTAAAFRGYLSARFGVPPSATTPPEVADSLRELGFDAERVNDAEALLRGCDAVRFADTTDTAVSPRAAAELIERWEGVLG